MLKRAVDAKEATERAEIEEALKLAYMDYVADDVINMGSSNSRFANAVSKVQSQGYENKLVVKPGESKSYKLSSSNMILANGETATITVEEDNSATSSDSKVYAVIDGKYYEVNEINGDIKIATTPKAPSEVDSGSSSSEITIGEVSSANESVATVAKEGNGVKVTAKSTAGTSKITVTVNGSAKEVNVEVVGSIVDLTNNDGYKLDGAMVPRDTTAGTGKTVSSSDESIAQVTTEGIVKCGTKTGETTVKIDDKAYKIKSTARIIQAGANKTLDGSTTGTANNPIIPTGFSAINTKDAQWKDDDGNNVVASNVNNGLVIMDEKGNQFVWVPVADINSMVMCKNNNKDGHTCNIQLSGDTLSCTETGHSDELCGKLYATDTGNTFNSTLTTQKYTPYSLREPDVLTDSRYGDWGTRPSTGFVLLKQYITGIAKDVENNDRTNEQIKAVWEKQLKDEFLEMAKSVAKNKGFYIGRYEASLINNSTRVIAGLASMSAGTTSAGTWYGLYQKQKEFISNRSIKSTMIWGSQYDAMMNWFGETTAKVNIGYNNRNRDSSTWKTGTVSTDKVKNVYDLSGLRYEWTLEAGSEGYRVYRGGSCDDGKSPSYRSTYTPDTAGNSGSRPVLIQ